MLLNFAKGRRTYRSLWSRWQGSDDFIFWLLKSIKNEKYPSISNQNLFRSVKNQHQYLAVRSGDNTFTIFHVQRVYYKFDLWLILFYIFIFQLDSGEWVDLHLPETEKFADLGGSSRGGPTLFFEISPTQRSHMIHSDLITCCALFEKQLKKEFKNIGM